MKLKILGLTAAAALLALQSTRASADTDVYVGLEFGAPAPVYVERRPVYREYYYEPAPVYYYESYPRTYVYSPSYEVRYYERHHHDRGWHRGHRHHHHR